MLLHHRRRYERLGSMRQLDAERDCAEIYRQSVTLEFPWDYTRSLELALYRTYAVPTIGRLLARTGELTERPQKRYDDTALLLDSVLEHGFEAERGRTAIRRINQMHRSYDISDDDMRYVLSTFVVMPARWLDRYGWRPLSEHERRATVAYYRLLGRHMGIRNIPGTYEEFVRCLDDYEEEHFGWDEGSRAVSDATLALMVSWYPRPLAPVTRRAAKALMDDSLLRAFRYGRPPAALRTLVRGALRVRAHVLRLFPPRRTPRYGRQNPLIRTCPGASSGDYSVAGLGTFPSAGEPSAATGPRAAAGSPASEGNSEGRSGDR
ncbi:oxygenase MpaB family protein [Streptomyces ovatisporus]|uniref:Oxygenase MpaB family protein n=1 Tax=Streptomyces ovatisporus TaxID=1128682 RepID=A0ABV9A9X4_9ACTN